MRVVGPFRAVRQKLGLEPRVGQGILLLLLLAPLSGNPGSAQNPAYMDPGQAQGSTGQRIGNRESPFGDPDADPFQDERRLRALNSARQKSMVSDTEKLLRLATELNAEMAGEKGATLTVAQMRKVAEIEKLARNVKDKMSTSVRGFSVYPAAGPLQYP
jgi:hypothetical protein